MWTWQKIFLGESFPSCGDYMEMSHIQGEHLMCFQYFSALLMALWSLASIKGKRHRLDEISMFLMLCVSLRLVYCRRYHSLSISLLFAQFMCCLIVLYELICHCLVLAWGRNLYYRLMIIWSSIRTHTMSCIIVIIIWPSCICF